jgi:hypothetical protein
MKAATAGIIIGLGASALFAAAGLIALQCRAKVPALRDDVSVRTEGILPIGLIGDQC